MALPAVVQEAVAGTPATGGEMTAAVPRTDRPDRAEGERGGRRSRRGGRRRRREPGEAGAGREGAGEGEGPEIGGDAGPPGPQSFDFERITPVVSAPIVPAASPVPEPRQEWTPGAPSDATREGPRSEP